MCSFTLQSQLALSCSLRQTGTHCPTSTIQHPISPQPQLPVEAAVLYRFRQMCRLDVLLPGDAESYILQGLPLGDIDVLKISHHGSNDEGLPALLQRIGPAVALISVGRDNSFGHPTSATLDALDMSGTAVFRTDRDGDLTLSSSDGLSITIQTANSAETGVLRLAD